MPKKFKQVQYSKPASSAHPSLSPTHHGSPPAHEAPSTSVNDLIQQSRRAQASKAGAHDVQAMINSPTVHPSLQSLLHLPSHPVPQARPQQPRRPLAHSTAAGPAPPKSWGFRTVYRAEPELSTMVEASSIGSADLLPGLTRPRKDSLTHLSLQAMALRWQWHVDHDGVYLTLLPAHTKQMLLSYVARHAPQGVTKTGLETLCCSDAGDGNGSDRENITHLDLGRGLDAAPFAKSVLAVLAAANDDTVPEAWDAPSPSPFLFSPFPALTHLSLASPFHHSTAWLHLLQLLPHLSTLTHLSLAHWPAPAHPSVTATSTLLTTNTIWAEAAPILRRLSRATLCLRWLDVTGCAWIAALELPAAVDWCGSWRGVQLLRGASDARTCARWRESRQDLVALGKAVNLRRGFKALPFLRLDTGPCGA